MYFPLLKKFVCGTEEMDQQLRTLAVFLEDPGSDSGTHLRWLPNIFTPAPGNPTPLASLCTLMNAYVHKIQKCEEKKKSVSRNRWSHISQSIGTTLVS